MESNISNIQSNKKAVRDLKNEISDLSSNVRSHCKYMSCIDFVLRASRSNTMHFYTVREMCESKYTNTIFHESAKKGALEYI